MLVPFGSLARATDDDDEVKPQILVNLDTGEVLSHENAFRRWPPASLTKMMTAYVVFRAMKLQQVSMTSPVRVSHHALSQPPTKMGFPVGTVLTIENALKIIMVKSANDISAALGEAISGSEWKFVNLMNSHTRRLGMNDTHFINTNGLHEDGQYTTARDFAVLTFALTKEFPEYAHFFKIPAIRFGKRRLRNHNALLEQFAGTNGMKTGYVCASGSNVVVRAERDGKRLAAVVLGGGSSLKRNVRAAKLLQEGFDGLFDQVAVPFDEFKPTQAIDPEHADITQEICPRKYRHMKKKKSKPKPEPELVSAYAPEETARVIDPLKLVSPKSATATDAGTDAGGKEEVPEEKPLSFKEMQNLYLTARKKVGEDVRVELGGATGPNPNGLLHKDGGFLEPVMPIPTKRPES